MKSNNRSKDIPEKNIKLSELTSEYGYEIYKKAKEKFPGDSKEDFNKIMNSLESSLIYFMGNEVNPELLDSLCDSICKSLKSNVKRLKDHQASDCDECTDYLFSKELKCQNSATCLVQTL